MLDEDCHETREKMLWYLSDLMEDATDFSWGSAQKHVNQKQNWARMHDSFKKPWFCKLFQNGQCLHSKDLELAGKVHRHIPGMCFLPFARPYSSSCRKRI